jgi:hypothetical protein
LGRDSRPLGDNEAATTRRGGHAAAASAKHIEQHSCQACCAHDRGKSRGSQ